MRTGASRAALCKGGGDEEFEDPLSMCGVWIALEDQGPDRVQTTPPPAFVECFGELQEHGLCAARGTGGLEPTGERGDL